MSTILFYLSLIFKLLELFPNIPQNRKNYYLTQISLISLKIEKKILLKKKLFNQN